MIAVTGVLLNTEDFNWRAEFWDNYENILRGTRCVQNKARVYLSWDDIVVEGYILKAEAQEQAQNPNYLTFNFVMFLTNYTNVSSIGDPTFPVTGTPINVNPFNMDINGGMLGQEENTTLMVRQLNSTAGVAMTQASVTDVQDSEVGPATINGSVSNSLLQSIRDSMSSPMVSINGTLVPTNQAVGQLTSGRRVAVPTGFAGASVFDDLQISLSSLDPSIVSYENGKMHVLTARLGDKLYSVRGSNPDPAFVPAKYGYIFDNTDEYIARTTNPTGSAKIEGSLFDQQRMNDTQLEQEMSKIFKQWGIDTAPPTDVMDMAKNSQFGTEQVSPTDPTDTIQSIGVTDISAVLSAGSQMVL
jgi:hypothetical protein